jgi:predicted exporter
VVSSERRDSLWRLFAVAWTVLVAGLLAHQVFLWTGGLEVDTDVLALLPRDERDQGAQAALTRLAERASRRVVVLVGAPDAERAEKAADAFLAALGPIARPVTTLAETSSQALLEALGPSREGLLAPEDRAFLERATPDELTSRALLLLSQPVGRRLGSFRDDPLQLFVAFLQRRAESTRVRPRGGRLWLEDGPRQYVVLELESTAPAFSFDGTKRLEPALALATQQARLAGADAVLSAGVPRFAEAGAAQANREMSTVGFGSMAAILLVMWLAFRSPRPLALVAVTVALGVAAGLSACVLVFGRVHVVTLVFGASLVGVAEDFGIHYFANRQASPDVPRTSLLWSHLPALALALVTSIAGYAMLAVAPFPGLRQVALFSGVGLLAAFLGTVAWFPFLDRGPVKVTRFSTVWAGTRSRWPVVRGWRAVAGLAALGLVVAVGLARLEVGDDVRELQSLPPALVAEQVEVGKLMGLPSPAQFFMVHGATEEEVLVREEALAARLDGMVERHLLQGYDAVSSWVPSQARQEKDRALALRARDTVLAALADELEEAGPSGMPWRPLSVAGLLTSPVGAQLSLLWLEEAGRGRASVVLLKGLGREGLAEVATLDGVEPGVRFVDRTGAISAVMGRYRGGMLWLLAVGHGLVLLALFARFGRRAWRAQAPTVLGTLLAVAAVGLLGEKLQLFHVLALWLMLGMGVDYGIFLLEHPSRQAGEAWLAVGLGAVSTLLSFGLLALSRTPAIHAFGLAMAVGIASVWALSPLFCDEADPPAA